MCDAYERHEKGRMTGSAFEAHLADCADCRYKVEADRDLLRSVREARPSVSAPGLWDRIESTLLEEQAAERASHRRRRPFRLFPAFRPAAAAAALVLVALVLWRGPFFRQPRLLEESALARVEKKEMEYQRAIAGLEELVNPKLADLDLELFFLYRDRLETIDEQIVQCQAELAENPGNAHIRRYLLAALKDKKSTLESILRGGESGWDLNNYGGTYE